MRLFVALELPPAAREEFAAVGFEAARRLHGRVRPVAAAGLHVTLAFLGERGDEDAGAVGGVLAGCVGDTAVGELVAEEILWLPRRRPGVLAVGLGGPGAEAAQALQERVATALVELDVFSRENRPWLPHVTVGRIRRGTHVRPQPLALPAGGAFTPPALTLFRSHTGAGGARYEPLARVEL